MAKIKDVINGQVAYLRDQLLSTFKDEVDFENDWKLMTILIGIFVVLVLSLSVSLLSVDRVRGSWWKRLCCCFFRFFSSFSLSLSLAL